MPGHQGSFFSLSTKSEAGPAFVLGRMEDFWVRGPGNAKSLVSLDSSTSRRLEVGHIFSSVAFTEKTINYINSKKIVFDPLIHVVFMLNGKSSFESYF